MICISRTTKGFLLLFCIVFSVFLGKFAFEPSLSLKFFKFGAYWIVALAFVVFALSLWVGARSTNYSFIRDFYISRENAIVWVFGIIAFFLIVRAEPFVFKTLMDEHIIAAVSKVMSEERLVYVPNRAYHMMYHYEYLNGFIGKRPIFFQFLASLVHDFTGYRLNNPIYLNVALIPALIVLTYCMGRKLGGRIGGLIFLVTFASIPILPQTAVSGGMEMLNLVMILATLLLAVAYIEQPSNQRLLSLCFSAILLAHTRYESGIFLAIPILVVVFEWIRQKQVQFYWPLFLCPFFLIPILWQHHVFSVSDTYWEMHSIDGRESPFSFTYFYDNLAGAISYFSSLDRLTPNSLLVLLMGGWGAIYGLLYFLRKIRERGAWTAQDIICMIAFFTFGCVFLLHMLYGWPFSAPVILRLSLPLQLGMCMFGAWAIIKSVNSRRFHLGVLFAACIFVFAWLIPKTSMRQHAHRNLTEKEYLFIGEFVNNKLSKRDTVIADNAGYYIINELNIVSTTIAKERKQAIKDYLSSDIMGGLYYVEHLVYDFDKSGYVPLLRGNLDDDFVKEVVLEEHINPTRKVVISKVIDVEGHEKTERVFESMDDYLTGWAESLP